MSRKQFVEENGATCRNWRWSWSFINEDEEIIIFGAWDFLNEGNRVLIFSEDWEILRGRKQPAYRQSREHIKLIEEEGYRLKIFPMHGPDPQGAGPARIRSFKRKLKEMDLQSTNGEWYACPR